MLTIAPHLGTIERTFYFFLNKRRGATRDDYIWIDAQ